MAAPSASHDPAQAGNALSAEAPPAQSRHCARCQHYYVTWDSHFPHGCRALGFKSRVLPAQEVLVASGMTCLAFQPRQKRPSHTTTRDGTA